MYSVSEGGLVRRLLIRESGVVEVRITGSKVTGVGVGGEILG